MSLSLKVILVLVVNIPLFSYLSESFLAGKDATENLTLPFGLLLLVIYSFQFLMIISLTWKNIDIKQAYPLFILLLILAFVGILNSESFVYSIIVLLQYFSVLLFSIWLANESVHSIKLLIIHCYFASLIGFVIFALLHFLISNGDFLFTLAQIQLPAYFLLFLFTYKILTVDRKNKFLFYATAVSYLLILLLGSMRATDLLQFRIQFLPIALFLMIVILLLPKFFWCIAFAVLIFNFIYNNENFVEIFLYRLGSFEERFSIIHAMALDSFYFMLPQGLGASNKLFDINILTVYSESARSLYPPHSGFAAMLFDSSVAFFILVFIFYNNLLKDMRNESNSFNFSAYFSNSKVPYLLIIILTYMFENLFYLKFSIAGATFSDDFLYVLLVILFFYNKSKKIII